MSEIEELTKIIDEAMRLTRTAMRLTMLPPLLSMIGESMVAIAKDDPQMGPEITALMQDVGQILGRIDQMIIVMDERRVLLGPCGSPGT